MNTKNISNENETPILRIGAVMGSASRMPESFLEFDGEALMSNFYGEIV